MLVLTILSLGAYILEFFFSVVTGLLGAVPSFPDISSGMSLVFSNIFFLNSFLPITDLFLILNIALIFKVMVFTWKAILFSTYMLNHVRKTFLQLRV